MLYTVISLADVFVEQSVPPKTPLTPPRSTDPFDYLTFTKPQQIVLPRNLDMLRREK